MRGDLLCLREVRKSYGRHEVLQGVSLEIAPGTVTGLVGENGAGKTTLLRIAVGQLAPDEGEVRRSERLGYCPQQCVLNDQLTVAEHLRLFQAAYGLPDLSSARELMDVLACDSCVPQRAGTLSGGTRQKINVVLALMHDPPLLVLDEPYQGFDWQAYESFWELAARLRDQGRSVLVVSHLAHDRRRFDELHHLRGGVLEEERARDVTVGPAVGR